MRSITTLLLILTLGLLAAPAIAERGDDTDRKSKNGRLEGSVAGVSVVLEYGRPNVNDRKIWGDLVPYGKVWRTGANEATTITLGNDATVGGETLPAGTYALFTIPSEGPWTIIFNSVADQWGAFNYDPSADVLRIISEPREAEHVESMDFEIDGSSIVLRWEELAVPIAFGE